MRIAITGGSGFIGRHLAARLGPDRVVSASRRDGVEIDDVDALTAAFTGCDAVAHCAGINRDTGAQTFRRVHVEGTAAVVEAARRAGMQRIVMVSFLRARPDCGSPYHESKWAAEEIVRHSGIPHTILKSGMVYGPGDHMVDHVTRAVRTLPFFWTVGYRERTARPVPVDDAVDVLVAALEGRISGPTIAVMGADELTLGEAIRRIARVAGRRTAYLPVPVWTVRALAQVIEGAMVVPPGREGAGADARRGRERTRPRAARRHPPRAPVQRRAHPRRAAGGPLRTGQPAPRALVAAPADGLNQPACTSSTMRVS